MSAINVARLLNFMSESSIITIERNVKIESIYIRASKFFGKAPNFYIKLDPLTEKAVEYDDSIYIKMFMNKFNINKENLFCILNENISNSEKQYHDTFLKDKESNSMALYFNFLSLLNKDKIDNEKLKYIYKIVSNSHNLNKFPLLYLKFLTEYNDILIKLKDPEDNVSILNNLVNIASIRKLTEEEEE
jgi:hypothetical protein